MMLLKEKKNTELEVSLKAFESHLRSLEVSSSWYQLRSLRLVSSSSAERPSCRSPSEELPLSLTNPDETPVEM